MLRLALRPRRQERPLVVRQTLLEVLDPLAQAVGLLLSIPEALTDGEGNLVSSERALEDQRFRKCSPSERRRAYPRR